MKTAIVLSGGGAKGAYQIGVWKALRRLGINYDIVTGTSVGALNGVLMVQQDFHTAIKLWSNIDYKFIFNKDFSQVNQKIYLTYIKEFIKAGGMDIANLEKAIDQVFDSERFFNSDIDFGIVVYNFSKLKAEFWTKDKLNNNNVKDYVIASSACYPAIKMKKIKNEKYIDGGIYDNIPINLSIDLGADRIITVDLKAPGIHQKVKDETKEIISITPNNPVGSFLKFDKQTSQKNIKYGYNDTLKVFHKMMGQKYTFYKRPYYCFIRSIEKRFKQNINKYLDNQTSLLEQLKSLLPNLILKNNIKSGKTRMINIIEFMGQVLKIDDSKIYFLNYYNYLIKRRFKEIPEVDEKLIKRKLSKKDFASLLGSKYIVKYIYQILKDKEKYLEVYSLAPIFKKEFLAAIYLISIGC